jgi:hypothetical protein
MVYLGASQRPGVVSGGVGVGGVTSTSSADSGSDYGSTSRAGVHADAEALLTCYGVGEEDNGSGGGLAAFAGFGGAAARQSMASVSLDVSSDAVPAAAGGGGGAAGVRGHSVVELSFTSSVRFLQPVLLLQVRRGRHASRLAPRWGGLVLRGTLASGPRPGMPPTCCCSVNLL